jgi:Na+-driven multidrug efflux pump
LLFSSVLNISLDYAFMAPLAMGIGGAAFATVLSHCTTRCVSILSLSNLVIISYTS